MATTGHGMYMDGVETVFWTHDQATGDARSAHLIIGGLFDGNARPIMVKHDMKFSAPGGTVVVIMVMEEILEAWNR